MAMLRERKNIFRKKIVLKGQLSLEFIFSMMIIIVMGYTLVRILLWGGMELGNRQRGHESTLSKDVSRSAYACKQWSGPPVHCISIGFNPDGGPMSQIDPYFYSPSSMKAYWRLD